MRSAGCGDSKHILIKAVSIPLPHADGKLYPLQNYGVKCMSMGFLMKVLTLHLCH